MNHATTRRATAARRRSGGNPTLAVEPLEPRALLAATGRVVATIPTGVTPQHMAITPDGRFGYVANNNNPGIAGQDSVTVFNLRTNRVVTTIVHPSFDEPYTVTIDPRGTTAYVTNSGSSSVSVIDVKTRTVTGVIGGFDGPSGMVIQGDVGYVNNYGAGQTWVPAGSPTAGSNQPKPNAVGSGSGNSVSIVDLRTRQITGSFLVGAAPAAIASDGSSIYTANYVSGNTGTGTISKYDISQGRVVATFGPAANAFTANVGGAAQSFGNPTDYQVLFSTPGTASGGVYNVAGRGQTAADYTGISAGQVALIARDVAQVGTEYLQAAVDNAVNKGASAVIFYNATFSGAVRTPTDGLTGTGPAGVFPSSVLFPGNLYQQPSVTAVGVPVAAVPVIFVSNKAVIQQFVGGASAGAGGAAVPGVSVSLTTATGFSGPFAMAIRGRSAYVTNFGSNNFAPFGTTLVEVDLRQGTIANVFPVGIQPSGVAISRNGRYAFVTNYNTLYGQVPLAPYSTTPGAPPGGQPQSYDNLTPGRGTVSVVDLRRKRVTSTIAVDESPSNVVVAPDRRRAYVVNYTANTVNVIRFR